MHIDLSYQHCFIRIDLGITGQDVVAESGGEGTLCTITICNEIIFIWLALVCTEIGGILIFCLLLCQSLSLDRFEWLFLIINELYSVILVHELLKLGFGKCKLAVQVSELLNIYLELFTNLPYWSKCISHTCTCSILVDELYLQMIWSHP